MSDYYYLENIKDSENWPILGEDYIASLRSIAKKEGIKITDEMILKEIEEGQFTSSRPKKVIKKPRTINVRGK